MPVLPSASIHLPEATVFLVDERHPYIDGTYCLSHTCDHHILGTLCVHSSVCVGKKFAFANGNSGTASEGSPIGDHWLCH
jgi:hypothetical protein